MQGMDRGGKGGGVEQEGRRGGGGRGGHWTPLSPPSWLFQWPGRSGFGPQCSLSPGQAHPLAVVVVAVVMAVVVVMTVVVVDMVWWWWW